MPKKNPCIGPTFDSWLKKEGLYEEVIANVLARMKKEKRQKRKKTDHKKTKSA